MVFSRLSNFDDGSRAVALQLAAIRHRAAVSACREALIETAGDCLCGAGQGPTRADLATLERLEAIERRARSDYANFMINISLVRGAVAATA